MPLPRKLQGNTSRFYRPELDALRFFAFLCVFAFHWMDYVAVDPATQPMQYAIATAGAFGVPVFFLLSSFLIVELLLRERAQTGSIHIRSFYVRRILRIWPLYFAAFFGLVVLGHFLPNVGPKTYGTWAAFLLFAGNWYIVHHGWIAGPLDPLWSIAVEEQFYIAIPLLSRIGGRKVIAIVSAVLLIVSYGTVVHYARMVYSGESGQWVNSWFQFQFFAAGALLAIALHGRVPRWPMALRALVFLTAAGCWIYAVMGPGVKSYDAHTTVAGAIGGWLLVLLGSILFVVAALGVPERYIPNGLTYLGRISYGLYIFHSLMFYFVFEAGAHWLPRAMAGLHWPTPVVSTLDTALVMLLSIASAALSYRYFEKPFLKLKERFTFVQSRPE